VYCQYLQLYETDEESISLAMRTLAGVFEHTSVWRTPGRVMLVLGLRTDRFALDSYRLEARTSRPDFRAGLARAGIHSFPELLAHELLPLDVLGAARLPGPIHSLYHPRLNALAARAAFRGGPSEMPFTGFGRAAEVGAENSLLRRYAARFGGRIPDETRAEIVREACAALGSGCAALLAEWAHQDPESATLRSTLEQLDKARPKLPFSSDVVDDLMPLFASTAQETTSPGQATRLTQNFESFYHHAAPFSSDALLGAWSACREGASKEEACLDLAERDPSAIPGRGFGFGIEDEHSRCLLRSGLGQRCRDGLLQARSLLERGVPAETPGNRASAQPRR
jgi:hypothetical protein